MKPLRFLYKILLMFLVACSGNVNTTSDNNNSNENNDIPESEIRYDLENWQWVTWSDRDIFCMNAITSFSQNLDTLWVGAMTGLVRWKITTKDYAIISYPKNINDDKHPFVCGDIPCGVLKMSPIVDSDLLWVVLANFRQGGGITEIGMVDEELRLIPLQSMIVSFENWERTHNVTGIAAVGEKDLLFTSANYLYKFNYDSGTISEVFSSENEQLLNDVMLSPNQDQILIAAENSLYIIFDDGSIAEYTSDDNLSSFPITKIHYKGGAFILASIVNNALPVSTFTDAMDQLSFTVDILDSQFISQKSFDMNNILSEMSTSDGQDSAVTDVDLDENSNLWFATNNGIGSIDNQSGDYNLYQEISDFGPEVATLQQSGNNLFFGTGNGIHLYQIDQSSKIEFDQILSVDYPGEQVLGNGYSFCFDFL